MSVVGFCALCLFAGHVYEHLSSMYIRIVFWTCVHQIQAHGAVPTSQICVPNTMRLSVNEKCEHITGFKRCRCVKRGPTFRCVICRRLTRCVLTGNSGPLRVAQITYPLKIGITDGCTHDSPCCCCEGRQCHTDVYM